jgi:phosphoesterase RecJ-like protein
MTPVTDAQAEAFGAFIERHEFFIVAGHKDPDGDSLASCLGVAAILRAKRKQYQLFSAGPFKRSEIRRYEALFPSKLPDYPPELLAAAGLIIVDCSERERLGAINLDLSALDLFIIDHHLTAGAQGGQSVVDPSAPSAALLVQQLHERLAGAPDADTARALFFGLATDTSFFRFLTPRDGDTFRAAGRLADYGANPRQISDEISTGHPFKTRKLLGVLLCRAQQTFGGRVAYTYETLEDTRRYGRDGRDSDSLYRLLLSAGKTEAVVFVRQETDTSCTAGLRSRGDLDVSAVAAKLGGGGHKNAAGLSTEGTFDALLSAILNALGDVFSGNAKHGQVVIGEVAKPLPL